MKKKFKAYYGFRILYVFPFPSAGHEPAGAGCDIYKMVSTQYQFKIRVLQSDNGGEYLNSTLKIFFNKHGIHHQTSCTGTPQQNGSAERKNRQLLEIVRASLYDMNVPREYWGEAVRSAAYLINHTI